MIPIADIRALFRLQIDEFQTDNFTDGEIDTFVNSAQQSLYKQWVSPDTNVSKQPSFAGYFETSQKVSEYLQPFFRKFYLTLVASSSLNPPHSPITLTVSAIETETARTLHALRSLEVKFAGRAEYAPVKWKSHSEHAKQVNMAFFSPTDCNPYMVVENGKYDIYPNTAATAEVMGVALVHPTDVDTGVDSEFVPAFKNAIVYKAIEMAGISIRDEGIVNNMRLELDRFGV
jgi:hypothetical protein